MAPPVVALSREPEAIEEMAKEVVVAAVPVAFAKTKLPVRVVEERVAPVPKTSAPLPVSSPRSPARSAEVCSEVEESFAEKIEKSAAESLPVFAAEATGRLYVMVFPDAVMVKSVPVVEVANVTAGPVWSIPAGPIEVTAEVRYVFVSIMSVPSPPLVFTKPFEVRLESLAMFCVVFTLKEPDEYVRPVPAVVVEDGTQVPAEV
jgi:hypothetical protein